MGSRQPKDFSPPEREQHDPSSQDNHLPFGYMPREALLHDDNMFVPVPGQQPLLSENDQMFFRDFFNHIIADPSPETNFGEGLNFTNQWSTDLQPQQHLIGHQTHPSNTSMNSILQSLDPVPFDFISEFNPPMPHQLSPGIIGAAHVLSRPGVPHSYQYGLPDGLPSQPPATMGHPMGGVQNGHYQDFPSHQRPIPGINLQSSGYPEMFNSAPPPLPGNARPVQHPEIHFGTDTNFSGGNFNPSGERDINERVFRRQESILECLEPNTSAAPTRASSPQRHGIVGSNDPTSPLKLRTRQFTVPVYDDHPNQPPKKRRKSKAKVSPGEDDRVPELENFDVVQTPARTARGSSGSITRARPLESSPIDEPVSAGGRRRRGAGGAAAKPPRENLTEQQKRENHIKSEQKRRTLIRDGFDDIHELVPELKGSGLSKSHVLNTAAEYLEKIMLENDNITKLLSSAKS